MSGITSTKGIKTQIHEAGRGRKEEDGSRHVRRRRHRSGEKARNTDPSQPEVAGGREEDGRELACLKSSHLPKSDISNGYLRVLAEFAAFFPDKDLDP